MALTEKYVSALAAGGGDGSSGNPWTWAEMVTDFGTSAAGTRYNIKADGTYSRTTTADALATASGSATSPKILRGYSSVIGDGYQGRTNSNGPLVTTNMPVITYTTGSLTASANFVIIEALNISGARNGATLILSGTDCFAHWCKMSNAAAGSSGITCTTSGSRCGIIDCDLALSNGGNAGSTAINVSAGAGPRYIANRITSTAAGILLSGIVSSLVANNTIYGCAGIGISATGTGGSGVILGNTVVGGTTDGIDIVAGQTGTWVIGNNCITDNGGYGIDLNNANVGVYEFNNRYRDNTSGTVNLGTDWTTATNFGVVTSGSGTSDYVNSGSNDYRLIPTSPATSAALPLSASMGALQRVQNAPIAGATVVGSSVGRASRI
jgi:hypothetical protein